MLRLEGVVAAVTQDGMSLALLSRHEAILDHYGKILVERLRAVAPEIGIEIYFPASAEALLARFNAALGDYTVQQAMEANVPIAPPKIWIVHDASALPDHEIQLLARLVQHFPGANIRVVMLLPQGSKKQKLLISFGRRILNWEIDPPTPEQADNMLAGRLVVMEEVGEPEARLRRCRPDDDLRSPEEIVRDQIVIKHIGRCKEREQHAARVLHLLHRRRVVVRAHEVIVEAGQRLAVHICYEDLFGEELATRFIDPASAPTALVNVSNLAWFGDGLAIYQHLSIARMRALEFGLPVLRSTNTGATAIIAHTGVVQAQLPYGPAGVLQGQVQGRSGLTPFARWAARWGLWPLWLTGLTALAWAAIARRRSA
jgi:hypothetical protein